MRTDEVGVSMSSMDQHVVFLNEDEDEADDDDDDDSDSSDGSQISNEDDYTYSPSTISTAASSDTSTDISTDSPLTRPMLIATSSATLVANSRRRSSQRDEEASNRSSVNRVNRPVLTPATSATSSRRLSSQRVSEGNHARRPVSAAIASRHRRSSQKDEEASILSSLRKENIRLRQTRGAESDVSMPVVNARASGSRRGLLQHLMVAQRAIVSDPMFQVGLGSVSVGLAEGNSSELASDVSTSLGSTSGDSNNLPSSSLSEQDVVGVRVFTPPPSLLIPLEDSMQGVSVSDQVNFHLNLQLRESPLQFGINILNQIGTHTYRAYHIPTMSIIAVKAITVQDKKRMKRIKNELDTYAKGLRHPNLLFYSCTFAMRATSTLLMVYELMEGGSLHMLLSLTQGLTPQYVIRNDETPSLQTPNHFMLLVARSIGAGLAYLHCRGVIHREVRPSCVVMNKRRTLIKLADLGRAYQLRSDQTGTMTPAGMAQAALFTAPERLRGEKYSSAADVWSLGMCLLSVGLGRVSPLAQEREEGGQGTDRMISQLEQLVRVANGVEVLDDWDESVYVERMGG